MTKENGVRDGISRTFAPIIALGQRALDAALIIGSLVALHHAHNQLWRELDTVAAFLAVISFYLVSELNGLYRAWRVIGIHRELGRTLASWAGTVPTLLFVAFATKYTESFSRVVMVAWFLVTPIVLVIVRLLVRVALQEVRRAGRNSRTAVVVGMTRGAERLAEHLVDPTNGIKLIGFYDDRIPSRHHQMAKEYAEFLGGYDELIRDVKAKHIDYVYVALPLRAESRITEIVQRLSDTTASVYVIGDFFVFDLLHSQWSTVGDIPVVAILDTPFQGLGGWVKRLEDIVIGTLILMLIAIPLAVIAIAIKLTSKGPVFFVQKRYGLNGAEIPVIKFRSMTVMENGPNVAQATKGDARITKLGAFLRRTSLDELPQFFNVLAGHMSIVGPRPHAVAHNEMYREKIQRYMLRHKVRPGITGWAQVNGWRGETDTLQKMEKRLEHDLYYIHNWDLAFDLRIIFLTVFGRKVRSNAY